LSALVAGTIAWGFNPVTNLSQVRLSAVHSLGLTLAGLADFAAPLLAVAAFGIFLSVVTRNSAAAIVGTLVYELVQEAIVGLVHVSWLQRYLLSSQFNGWHGFFRSPTDWTPITRSLVVSAVFAAIPLAVAFLVFLRRDVSSE